ncbi:MFS transporter [Saccharothrix coeruleofusca]|uniref:MFS transporter n=1 Tax=Saccharothrix coeruleofusca TaxID=33919 RepID=UPI0016716EB3|nr:MFS transporter [Saccharothrix coeruleofusca]
MTWGRLQAVVVSGSVGEGLLLTALPLIAVSITKDPQQVALVKVVGQLPWLLFSLFAGVLIDRVRRTAVLGAAYAVLACAALALAVTDAVGALTLPLLLGVAFVVTSAQVLGDGTTGALLPEVVGPDRLAAANTRLILIDQGAVRFVVPPVAGFLVAWSAGASAWAACAAAVLALLLTRGLSSAAVTPSRGHPLRDIPEGLKYLVGTRLLLAITVAVGLGSFASSAWLAMFALYSEQELGLGPVGYGVLMTCVAVGWVAGSFAVDRVVVRLGYAWSMRVSQIGTVLLTALVAVLPPWPAAVGAVLLLQSAVIMLWNVCSQSSRQRFTPGRLLGRVLTSHRALAWGLTPLGALVGGLVGAGFGLRAVWVLGAAVQLVAAVVTWRYLSPAGFRAAEEDRRSAAEPA